MKRMTGPYSAISDAVHEKRETELATAKAGQHRHAVALRAMASEIHTLAKRAMEIPGTYRVWAHLEDSAAHAEQLAKEWGEQ